MLPEKKAELQELKLALAVLAFANKHYTINTSQLAGLSWCMACYHKLYKSHSWLYAQQTQAIDSHCFYMQLFTIIHEDSASENGSFSIISFTELSAKKIFQKGNLENKSVILTLSGAGVHAQSVGIDSYMYWELYRFIPGHFLKQWNITTVSSAQMEESMETPMFLSASQNTTLEKPLLEIVYLQQLQQVISNDGGGPQLPTQGCVYAYRAASQMGGTFSPQWREQRENLKQFYDILDYKKMSRMILTLSGWLFTQLCSKTL